MIKSVLILLAAGGFAWAAVRAPGPPERGPEFRFTGLTHYGRSVGVEGVRVRPWERNILVQANLAGGRELTPDSLFAGSLRVWVDGDAYPRQDYTFRGASSAVPCPVSLSHLPCRVVICAEDNEGHRETRSFTVDVFQ